MKKLFLLLFFGGLLFSCSKDNNDGNTTDTSSGLSNTPTAKAAYDSSNYGIYKGVFVGSSGNVFINIKNDGTSGTLSATLIIDGTSFAFTTTETVTLNTAIIGLTFTNGSSYFDFNVDASGNSVTISNVHIDGHPLAAIFVIKEKSDKLVRCFQGTAKQDGANDSATFNLIVFNGEVHGLAAGSDNAKELQGTEVSNQIVGHVIDDTILFTGTISDNTISGSWHNTQDSTDHGTWTGTRKL